MTSTQQLLTKELEKLSLSEENKETVELLDDALINAMKGEYKAFALECEKFLIDFIQSSKTTEMILNMDKYQRKIVHKICDLYGVTREYVDVKPNDLGDITIVKTSSTAIPKYGLEKRYKKLLSKQKKETPQAVNPLANKKVLIKPRVVKKAEPENESSGSSSGGEGGQNDNKSQQSDVEQRKQQQYEEARSRIMQDKVEESVEAQREPKELVEKPRKKGLRPDQVYDPDFDRNMAAIENSTNVIGFLPFPMYNPTFNQPTGVMNPYSQSFVPGYATQVDLANQPEYSYDFPPLSANDNNQKKK